MSEIWKKILLILFAVLLLGAMAVNVAMIVSAVRFGELGRVLLYGLLFVICLEILIVVVLRIRKQDNA